MVIDFLRFCRQARHQASSPATISNTHRALDSEGRWRCLPGSPGGMVTPGGSCPAGTMGKLGMRDSRCAFALIEVLIGSGLLGVMSVSLYLGIAQGFAFVQIARENLRATQILQEKLETVRLYTWDQVIQPGFIPSAFTNYYYPSGGSGSQGAVYRGITTV